MMALTSSQAQHRVGLHLAAISLCWPSHTPAQLKALPAHTCGRQLQLVQAHLLGGSADQCCTAAMLLPATVAALPSVIRTLLQASQLMRWGSRPLLSFAHTQGRPSLDVA